MRSARLSSSLGAGTHHLPLMDAIWQPVFLPSRLVRNVAAYSLVVRYGWILIVVRWLYYALIFQFRDYQGSWMPFARIPFGLSIEAYASLQRWLALPFGVMLMSLLAAGLVVYLRLAGTQIRFRWALNVLGTTFFLPFAFLQPCDYGMIALIGWRMIPTIVLHTAVLVWESWAAAVIVSVGTGLSRLKRTGAIVLLCALWIGVSAAVWR